MSDTRANPLLAVFRDRIRRKPHAPLIDCIDQRGPDAAELLAPVIDEYAAHRRDRGEGVDFEEFRSAIPWIFDSGLLLDAAIDAVIDTGLVLGQSPETLADALIRAHPMTAPGVARSLERWRQSAVAPGRHTGLHGMLPQDFGPESLDGGPRYVLTRLRGPVGRGWAFDAIDRDDPSAGNGAAVPVEITVWPDDGAEPPARLGTVSSPGLARVRDQGQTASGQAFLVHERVEGRVLDGRAVPSGRSRPRRCVELIARLSRGLEEAHAQPVIHAGIRPSRVRIRPDGTPVLTGLGLAQVVDHSGSESEYGVDSCMSFIAPECWSSHRHECGPRSDLYALAGLLYWLLTGCLPNGKDASTATRLLHDGASVLREYPAAIPAELRRLCEQGLHPDPRQRPVSVTEWRRSLEDWLDGRPPIRAAPFATRAMRLLGRHRRLAAAAAAVLCVPGGLLIQARRQIAADRERIARLDGRYEASLKAMDRWTKAMIATKDIDPALRLVMFDVVRLAGGVEGDQALSMIAYNAESARSMSDELAAADERTIQAAMWHIAAGYLSFEANYPDTRAYLLRARAALAATVGAEDPWVKALDDMLTRVPLHGTAPDPTKPVLQGWQSLESGEAAG